MNPRLTVTISMAQRKQMSEALSVHVLTVKRQNTNNLFSACSVIWHKPLPISESISEHELAACATFTAPIDLSLQSSNLLSFEFKSNLTFNKCTFILEK